MNTREVAELKDLIHSIRFDMRTLDEQKESKEKSDEKLADLQTLLKSHTDEKVLKTQRHL